MVIGSTGYFTYSKWWQLKYFLEFSPRTLGKMNPFWRIFFKWVGWNHQPVIFGQFIGAPFASRAFDPDGFGGFLGLSIMTWEDRDQVEAQIMKLRSSGFWWWNTKPNAIHVWYIYLHEWLIFMSKCIGRYTIRLNFMGTCMKVNIPYMDGMGNVDLFLVWCGSLSMVLV